MRRKRRQPLEAAVRAPAAAAGGLPRGYDDVPYEIVPTSRQRRLIAEHMIRSRQTAAHMTTEAEVDTALGTISADLKARIRDGYTVVVK